MVMCDGSAINIKFIDDKTKSVANWEQRRFGFEISVQHSQITYSKIRDTSAPKTLGLMCRKATYVTIARGILEIPKQCRIFFVWD